MSTKKLVGIFLTFLVCLQVFVCQVVSLPTLRPPVNATSARNPRLLGKFSFVAGLNLPGHTPVAAAPPSISRDDFLYERPPSPNRVSFNYPGVRGWGPYVAAVYEPLPLVSFFNNPMGYLASLLNPFNWFGNGDVQDTPPTTTNAVPSKDRDDLVLLVDDSKNEIHNEDRAMTKPVMKFTEEPFFSKKSPTTIWTTASFPPTKDYITTVEDNDEPITDLVSEETTLNLIERLKNITREVDESRQFGFGGNKKTTTTRTTTTLRPTKPTAANATNSGIGGTNTTAAPQNTTSDQTYPTQRPSGYWNGYYYGGYPQNVSNLQFTTPPTPSFRPIPQQINFFEQQRPQQPPSVDYFGRFDNNFLPDVSSDNNYYANDRTEDARDNWYPNGFKPSYHFRF